MKRLIFSSLLFLSCAAPAMQPEQEVSLLYRAIIYTYKNPMTVIKGTAAAAVVVGGVLVAPIPTIGTLGLALSNPQTSKMIEQALKAKGN